MTSERAIDILEKYGWDRMLVNSSADWGPSDPFTLQACVLACRRRGFTEAELVEIFHNAPVRFLQQCPKWDIPQIRVETK